MMLKTTLRTSSVLTAVDIIIESEPNRRDPSIHASNMYNTPNTLTVAIASRGDANSRTRKAMRSPWMATERILLAMYWVLVKGHTRICSNIPNLLSNQMDAPA